jgi:hypothetical protein
VDTRWQQNSSDLQTNNTQNTENGYKEYREWKNKEYREWKNKEYREWEVIQIRIICSSFRGNEDSSLTVYQPVAACI